MGSKKLFILISLFVFITNFLFALVVFKIVQTIKNSKVTNSVQSNTKVIEKTIPEQIPSTTVVLGGDVMFGRFVNRKGLESGNFGYTFENISGLLKESDIVFVNLEGPFVHNCPIITEGYSFCADPRMVSGLVYGRVDVVNLANNHIRNFGQKGVDSTVAILNANNIAYTGFRNLVLKDVNGVNFGFLGFDFTTADITQKDIDFVKESKEKCDVLIAAVHWGEEYKAVHNAKQERIGKTLVENGVDVIAGSHPHWIQDIGNFDNKPVFYSLGNLVFDQLWSEETKKGVLVKLIFKGKGLVNFQQIPVYISEVGEPSIN